MPPTPTAQIRFLTDVQRLLSEGLFTDTYKYALLSALADLSVETGDDSGDPLTLTTFAIAEKFVEYYWRHAAPYAASADVRVLRQNTGNQAKVVALVAEARRRYGDSLPSMMRDRQAWSRLVRAVEGVVQEQSLWKLQRVGKEELDFLYGPGGHRDSIELRSGVVFCFRRFYSLIQNAVRSAWLRDVRVLNRELLGEALDLREFLFGAERTVLGAVRPVLRDLQDGKCFYCSQPVRSDGGDIDHFIPWSKYPIDLGHNLVLTDARCNGKKRDRMPHVDHLAKWTERNRDHAIKILAAALKDQIPCDLGCTNRIAFWAYNQTEVAHGLTWLRGDELFALSGEWRRYL